MMTLFAVYQARCSDGGGHGLCREKSGVQASVLPAIMGHSIQIVGNRVKFFKDGDLSILLFFLEQEVSQRARDYRNILHIVRGWKESLPRSGPGTIWLGLGHLILSDGAKCEFLSALDAVSHTLKLFGDHIPGAYLNQLNNVPGVIYSDYSVERGIGIVGEFRSLFERDED